MSKIGISILVSTFNGKERISTTLKALAALDRTDIPFVELIFTDNGSTDGTLEDAKTIWNELNSPFQATFLTEKKPGKLNAQELALTYAKGEFIIICDDDNELHPNYLVLGYQLLKQNPKIGALGGKGIGVSTCKMPDWFENYQYFYGCGPQAPITGEVRPTRSVVYGAGMWFRFDAYQKSKELGYKLVLLGRTGKKLSVGEDSELCWVIRFQGYEIWYVDEMCFKHHMTENRLTTSYLKMLLEGMTSNGLNGLIHLRVDRGEITQKVKLFWLKELLYSFKYLLGLSFNFKIDNKQEEIKRTLNAMRLLIKQRSDYDKTINNVISYKAKCDHLLRQQIAGV